MKPYVLAWLEGTPSMTLGMMVHVLRVGVRIGGATLTVVIVFGKPKVIYDHPSITLLPNTVILSITILLAG